VADDARVFHWVFDVRRSTFNVPLFPPMKTPPFVLGATLLFWGWQTDFLIPGAIMGTILEGSRFLKLRWDLKDDDFKRIWTFCALLFLATAVYAFADNGGPEGFGRFFQGPTIASEREVGSASARTAASLIRWLPMVFFLFVAAQAYSSQQEIPLRTISLILQRRWKQAKKLGKPLPPLDGADVAYPYFALCLFAASVHPNRNNSFFWGLCGLLGWVLWVRRPRRFGAAIWMAALALAILFGYSGARGIGLVQRYVDSFNMQFIARLLSRSQTDPSRTQTQIGQIGRVETSPRIVIRLKPISGEFPYYLREASYRTFRSPNWYANRNGADMTSVEHAATNENTYIFGLSRTNESRVGIACFLENRDRNTRNPMGLLPLPSGSARLENLVVYTLQKNRVGAVLAEGPGLLQFQAIYGPGMTIDSPPETNVLVFGTTNLESPGATGGTNRTRGSYGNTGEFHSRWMNSSRGRGTDLQIPTNEIPALDAVVAELNLRGLGREEALKTIGSFFATKFTYRLWQDADNDPVKSDTPLSRFLLKTRAGHCEYFATATVLLLRDLGIPARYAVGYSVHEAASDGYVVRQQDAHAWCLAWNEQKKIWEDFDTTPGVEADAPHRHASLWLSDTWWWLRFQFSKLRWGQTHLRDYILIGLVPVLVLLLIQILRQRRRRGMAKGAGRAISWPGLDSEFYQIEKQLAERGLLRGVNEPLANWLERAAAEPELATLKDPLGALLRLHYRYRFDPKGLSANDREELRRAARECRETLSRLEQSAGA
jgi:protein-glutamine gamma-glutamyltransferase